jgi:hypothetical protein
MRLALLLFLDTALPVIESAFTDMTNRDDIGIILINQHVSVSRAWIGALPAEPHPFLSSFR